MGFEDTLRQIVREEISAALSNLSLPNNQNKSPEYLKVKEAAKFLHKSQTKVYEYLRKPGFPAIKIDGTYLIPKDALIQWMNEQKEKSA